ncbi:MAG: biotin-independent malonate decarboxylase subunit gamma, partial [Paraburkholderia tropica]
MNESTLNRGARWLRALAGQQPDGVNGACVQYADSPLGGETARFITVAPDADNRFPRARDNVVGLEQGWRLAQAVRDVIDADKASGTRRPIVAIVDVKSQAY